MDPKELKKLQGNLKKDQEVLKKAQELLAKGQGTLTDDRGKLEDDVKKFEALQSILIEAQKNLAKDQEDLAEDYEALTKGQEVLAEDQKALYLEKERLGPLSVIEPTEALEIDPKWLKDQIFRGKKEGKPIQKPGKKFKTRIFEPFERPMTATDVLSFRVDGNEVVIVTADGQKLKVKK